jgi:ABC-type glycerol-3-phosphate transport system substrate-binding protein
MVNATGYYSIINDPAQSEVVGKFAMALPPGGNDARETLLFGWLAGVTSKSDNPDGAWKFLEYALGTEGIVRMIDAGAPPAARTSLLDNAAILEKLPYLPTLLEAAEIGDHLPYIEDMPRVISSLSEILNQMAVGGVDVSEGLESANAAVTEILAGSDACG